MCNPGSMTPFRMFRHPGLSAHEVWITSKALVHEGIGLLHASVLYQQSAFPLFDTSSHWERGSSLPEAQ